MKNMRYIISSKKMIPILAMFFVLGGCASTQIATKQDLIREALRIKAVYQISEPVDVVGEEIIVSQSARKLKELPDYEKLTYNATYLGINVGTMTASIKGTALLNGREVYVFEATAKTNAFFSKFFKVEDKFVSYMDKEDLRVIRQEVYRQEGNYNKRAIVDFDYANNKAYFKNFVDNSEKTVDIPSDVQDALTANYFVRMNKWDLGEMMSFPVYVDEDVYELLGLVKSKKKIRVHKLGKQDAYVFEPYATLNGDMVKKGKATGYFAIDEFNTPLQGLVKTPIFGKASISLAKIERK